MSENEILNKIIQGLEDLVKKSGGSVNKGQTSKNLPNVISGVNSIDEKLERKKADFFWEQFKKVLGVSDKFYENVETWLQLGFETLTDVSEKILSSINKGLNNKQQIMSLGRQYNALQSIEGWLALGFDTLTEVNEKILKTLKNIRLEAIDRLDKIALNTSKSSSGGGGGMDLFKNLVGFAAFAAGVYIIVSAMSLASDIKVDGVIKATLAVGIFVFAFLKFAKIQSDIKSASISFALFSATLLFLVLPLLYAFAAMPIVQFMNAILKMAVIFSGLIMVVHLLSKVKPNDLRDSSISFGLLSLVISFVILPMLILLARMPWLTFTVGLFKLSSIILSIYGLMRLMNTIKPNDVIKSSLGLGAFGLVVGMVLLPMLKSIYETPWAEILESIIKMGSIIGAVVGVIFLISKIPQAQLIGGAITVGLISVVLFALSFALKQYADMQWGKIMVGLIMSMVTVGIFGLALAGIGALVANPVVAVLLAIGGSVIMGISFILILLSLAMRSMSGDYDWKVIQTNIVQSAFAVMKFGFLMGIVGGILGLASPFIAIAGVVLVPLLIIMGLLAVGMKAFSGNYDWDLINENLKKSMGTLTSFAWMLTKFAFLFTIASPLMAVAGVLIMPLLVLLNLISVGIKGFADSIDWELVNENLKKSYDTIFSFGWMLTKLGTVLGLALPFILASVIPITTMMHILNVLANGMQTFAVGFNWENIRINIEEVNLALNDFMKFISNLSEGFLGKMFALMKAGPMISRMLELMGTLAEGISVFNKVDASNLSFVGKGLTSLGSGLMIYIKGVSDLKNFDNKLIDNLIQGVQKFNLINYATISSVAYSLSDLSFGIRDLLSAMYSKSVSILDVIKNFTLMTFIKGFETIDSAKIAELGLSLTIFSEGLVALSSDEINFTNLIGQIKNVIIPLATLTSGLGNFNKVYSDFGKLTKEINLEEKIKFSFDTQTGIQEKLLELQKQEISIQSSQLEQLQENGRLLLVIANKISDNSSNLIASAPNPQGTTITKPTFSTKQGWLNAINSTATSMSES